MAAVLMMVTIIVSERLGSRFNGGANTVCTQRGGEDRDTQAEDDHRIIDLCEGTRADCIMSVVLMIIRKDMSKAIATDTVDAIDTA